jgi:hypothetical protein
MNTHLVCLQLYLFLFFCYRVKHIIITSLLLVLGAMSMTWICDTITESGFGNTLPHAYLWFIITSCIFVIYYNLSMLRMSCVLYELLHTLCHILMLGVINCLEEPWYAIFVSIPNKLKLWEISSFFLSFFGGGRWGRFCLQIYILEGLMDVLMYGELLIPERLN